MPMIIEFFSFKEDPPSDEVVRATIAQLYDVEIAGVRVESAEGPVSILSVVYWVGTSFAVDYVWAAMNLLGGMRVTRDGQPRPRTIPLFTRRAWKDYSLLERIGIGLRQISCVRGSDS